MRRLCAWCGVDLVTGEKVSTSDQAHKTATHGICPPCREREIAEGLKYQESIRRIDHGEAEGERGR
jgi:hypothetical protein